MKCSTCSAWVYRDDMSVHNDGILVHVRGEDGGLTKFRVRGEATVNYSAYAEEGEAAQ